MAIVVEASRITVMNVQLDPRDLVRCIANPLHLKDFSMEELAKIRIAITLEINVREHANG